MSKETILFKSEERTDLTSAAAFLHQLADKLAEGEVTLKRGEEVLTLTIPSNVVLEIKAEEEAKSTANKRSLEIEIEWREGDTGTDGVMLE